MGAGGADILAATLLWAEPHPSGSRSSQPGALVSATLLLRPRAARRLVAALQGAPLLELASPTQGVRSWRGMLNVAVAEASLAGEGKWTRPALACCIDALSSLVPTHSTGVH